MTSILTKITFFFAEKFRPCTQFEYNSHGYTYIHCVYAISNRMYNISCVIKSANSGYYDQPDGPTPAVRQQTSDKTISPLVPQNSKVLFDFPYRRITTIFFIRCYGKRTILLFYGRFAISPDNSWQYWSIWESAIVHTDAIACVAFRWSVIGWN